MEEVAVCKWGVGDVNLDLHQTQDEADKGKWKVNRKKKGRNEMNSQRLRCLNRRLTFLTSVTTLC